MRERYLCVCIGRATKLEEIVHARSRKEAMSSWLRRHDTVDYILAQDGRVDIQCERILTEAEMKLREDTPLVEGARKTPL